jgi:hypothetical protein
MSKEGAKFVLDLIDKSIEKWNKVVLTRNHIYTDQSMCPLCEVFDDNSTCVVDQWKLKYLFVPDPDACPIYMKTGLDDCHGTPFYRTSIWAFIKASKQGTVIPEMSYVLNKNTRRADNQMLVFLYEVRRKQLLYLLQES